MNYAWPAGYVPATSRLVTQSNQGVSVSPLSGYVQTNTHPGSRWGWAIDMPAMLTASAAAFEAFIVKLQGREHRVQIYDFKRPAPRGTCNLSGVTVLSSASQFATSVVLTGCGASKTLLAGDWLSFAASGQLCMVTDNATANGSGVMTVTIRHALRTSLSSGSGVQLDKPTALYILSDSRQEFMRSPGRTMPGMSFEFTEVFA